ncbi:MAG: hypothetical protein Q8M16_19840 [Pirellulaceae bacterium]|nr:hypothetical protein [Pirellulaceae bacterium]
MDKAKLNDELVSIHEELGRVMSRHEALDGPMLQSLRLVAADIDRVLHAQKAAPDSELARGTGGAEASRAEASRAESSPAESTKEELPHTLEALAEQFSVDHPQTAALLSRMGYLLSNLGI